MLRISFSLFFECMNWDPFRCHRRAAGHEHGDTGLPSAGSHPSRSAHRFVTRLGLKWNIPVSKFTFDIPGDQLTIPYISPKDWLRFLLIHCPHLLWGGLSNQQEAVDSLQSFWQNYKHYDPKHVVYKDHSEFLGYCVPLALYGDEGRGRRRGNTTVFALEACLGLHGLLNQRKRKHCLDCTTCVPEEATKKRFCNANGDAISRDSCGFQATNMKEHCYMSHFLLFVLPCSLYKEHAAMLDKLLAHIAQEMKEVYFEGVRHPATGQYWKFVTVAAKGDQRWHEKIAHPIRSSNTKGRTKDLMMCMQCHAGCKEHPYEDVGICPTWTTTIGLSRPWNDDPPLLAVPYATAQGSPECFYKPDLFHVNKQGVMRHFLASSLIYIFHLGYFSEGAGEGVSGDVKLVRAHGHFKLFCLGAKKTPALRSFSRLLLNWGSNSEYPWFNVKGSDATLLNLWMVHLASSLLIEPGNPAHKWVLTTILEAAKCMRDFHKIVYTHHWWLAPCCAMKLYECGMKFLAAYALLAHDVFSNQPFAGFAMVPKVHQLRHLILDLEKCLRLNSLAVSPLAWGCEGGEDLIGKVCRLSRRTDAKTMMFRVLDLFLIKSNIVHKRMMEKLMGKPGKPKRPE